MCQKVPYDSRGQAMEDARRIRKEAKRFNRSRVKAESGRKYSPYLCPYCDKWHLSTMNQKLFKKLAQSRR